MRFCSFPSYNHNSNMLNDQSNKTIDRYLKNKSTKPYLYLTTFTKSS